VTNYFAASSLAQASQQAIAWIGQQVQTQASFLAYMDAFWVLMLISLSTKFWVAVGKAWSRKLFGAKLNACPAGWPELGPLKEQPEPSQRNQFSHKPNQPGPSPAR